MAKIKIAVAGCLGRMGQELSKQIINNKKLEFVGGFEHKKHKDINKEFNKVSDINSTKLIDSDPSLSIKLAKVLIDFTTPQSTLENIRIASQNKTAVIIGTTGMTEAQKKKVKSYEKKIPILMSSNMSLGDNLLFNLVQQTAHPLKHTDYDIEIAETHHKHKKDAPSGTALSLGEYVAKGRKISLNKSVSMLSFEFFDTKLLTEEDIYDKQYIEFYKVIISEKYSIVWFYIIVA